MKNNNLIDDKYIKIGQRFTGINTSQRMIEITNIVRGCRNKNTTYVICRDLQTGFDSSANLGWFKHLLLKPVINGELQNGNKN